MSHDVVPVNHKIMRKILVIAAFISFVSFNPRPASAQFFDLQKLEEQNPLIGKKVLEFNLPTVNGKRISLTQYRAGKSAIIFFWATWCPNCHEKIDKLSKSATEMKNKGIQIILVDIGENAKAVDSYVKRNKVPYDVFLDENSKVAEDYDIIGVPTFFFVGKDGIVKAMEHSIPDNYEEILTR